MAVNQTDPDHYITVTGDEPFGRAWFDCNCGIARIFASKRAANTHAVAHFAEVYGRPPEVSA